MMSGRQPTLAELAAWLEDRLDETRSARVTWAVAAGDPETDTTLRWLTLFHATVQDMRMQDPPATVAQRLRQDFALRAAGARTRPEPVELDAELVFDSRRDLSPVGVRSADDPDRVVYLAFRAPDVDLVVDVRRADDDAACIEGQVFGEGEIRDAPVFEATVGGDGWGLRTIDGDELGRFCLPEVPRAESVLRVTNGRVALSVPLDLRDL